MRSAPARPAGSATHWGPWLPPSQGEDRARDRGSRGLQVAPPPPLPLPPVTSSAKVTAPRLPSGRAEGRSCQLATSGAARQGSLITLALLRPPPPSLRWHRRPRQPPLAPAPPGRLARSLLRFSSRGLGPVERARESRRLARARATGRREEATVTWDRDARRCRLGGARLRRRHTPGCPRPFSPSGAQALVPRAGKPTLPHPARAAAGLESQTELSRRKGLAEGGWMGRWLKGWVGG